MIRLCRVARAIRNRSTQSHNVLLFLNLGHVRLDLMPSRIVAMAALSSSL